MKKHFSLTLLILTSLLFVACGATTTTESTQTPSATVSDTNQALDTMESNMSGMTDEEHAKMMQNDMNIQTAGVYSAYSPSLLANASTGNVVLFFHAGWCPSCIGADKDITENQLQIPANMTLLKVDYDDSEELKAKYSVTSQHTFVQIDADGKELKKWSGSGSLEEIVQSIQS